MQRTEKAYWENMPAELKNKLDSGFSSEEEFLSWAKKYPQYLSP